MKNKKSSKKILKNAVKETISDIRENKKLFTFWEVLWLGVVAIILGSLGR